VAFDAGTLGTSRALGCEVPHMPMPGLSNLTDIFEPATREQPRSGLVSRRSPAHLHAPVRLSLAEEHGRRGGRDCQSRVRESVGKQSAGAESRLLSNNRGFLERIHQLSSGISGFLDWASLATMRPSFGRTCRSSLIAGLVTTALQGLQMVVYCGRLLHPLRGDRRG
jgi:hypothetical protein